MAPLPVGVKPTPPPKPSNFEDDNLETESNLANDLSERELRWGTTVQGTKPSEGYNGKFSVQTVDNSVKNYEYQRKFAPHASQKDYPHGIGGKFGVKTVRKDKSAVGWENHETLQHDFQKDYKNGIVGQFGVQKDRVDKSAAGWDEAGKLQQHESQATSRTKEADTAPLKGYASSLKYRFEQLAKRNQDDKVAQERERKKRKDKELRRQQEENEKTKETQIDQECQQKDVCFGSQKDQKEALLNAEKLKEFHQWKDVGLEAYRKKERLKPYNNQFDLEKEAFKQELAETKRFMDEKKAIMVEMQKQQKEFLAMANKGAPLPPIQQQAEMQPIPNKTQATLPPSSMINSTNNSYNSAVPPKEYTYHPESQHDRVQNNFPGEPHPPPQISPPYNDMITGQSQAALQQGHYNSSHAFPNGFNPSLNGSFMNFQNVNSMQQMPPFHNMSTDMMAMLHIFNLFQASQKLPQPPPTPQPQIEMETSSESQESSSEESDEEEDEPEVLKIENQLFKSQSERHVGAKKTLNILVLGETGVGKSTWINGIANYMSFDTLEDALNAPQPICLIASKFAFYETNEDKIEVKLEPSHGEKDENEAFSDQGQSSTQEPKTYQFETSKYIVNIIDTPGIGDTRGIQQDKENTRKILNAIGQYKDLHAICFLFKANEARMTLSFKYCISELLLQLHKDAVENIIFFFTNARGTFYKPGDTMTPLSQFLTDLNKERGLQISLASDKICCTDNEAFRLVCAHFNGAKFTEEDFQNFAGSWKQSAAETHRFIEFAARQRPHHVADTVSINIARTYILHLAKPLADVNELIESNIKVFDDRKKDLLNTANNLNDLKKKLKISQIGIEVKQLQYPKTVCTGPECIETQKLPNTEQLQVIYKQICHAHCYLTGVNVEVVPEPHLVGCAAMAGQQNCQVCKCHWMAHMHIRFDQIKATIEVEDKNTKALIQKNEDAAKVKEKMIKDCENTIDELKAEQQKIIKTSLRFGSFLQANAILPYNDAFEKYVEQTINEEEKCTEVGGDRSKLDNLKKLLAEYRQEKALLSEAAKNPTNDANNPIGPDEINVMKAELFGLKNTGKTLESLFTATGDGIAMNNAHVTVRYVPPRKNYHLPQFGKYKNESDKKQKYDNSKIDNKKSKNKNKNKNKGNNQGNNKGNKNNRKK